ncbi:mandelate racemase/muconate lactonizing enzyme family protein [Bacillaceae bacterium SIJ1]|uniref:mandelate racemase/muconate lactonizing enzyme family protein n=1 Tax=Litoribacterium kuwaitense TaxID=1398745 RepID=UPI0013ED42C4|nr:mandelate racemase/muconate lactonizing enzyme family protein [Litoribacterium kuwaitense]NGP46439.1 mandelate racemase/muconate lactonizing enzyme family protein [Litoribacterium kuwaitense]
MSNLTISNIDVYVVAAPDAKYKTSSHYSDLTMTNTIVRIRTTDGYEGIGSAVSWTEEGLDYSLAEAIRHLIPFLIGKSARNREDIFQLLNSRCVQMSPEAESPIDIALWDLVSKFAKMPLYQFLGGARSQIVSYASTEFLPTIDDYLQKVQQLKDQGYRFIKFHTWCIAERDIALAEAIHDVFKETNLKFMMDAEGAYTRQEALKVAKKLAELDYVWLEAPLPDTDLDGYKELRQRVDIPIIPAGNTLLSLQQIQHGIQQGCWSSVRVDTTLAGGITQTRKILGVAEANGLTVELQSWGYTLSQAANLHIMLAYNNSLYFEQAVPIEPLEFGVKTPIRTDENGYVHAPEGYGLGIEVDWDVIEKNAHNKLSYDERGWQK